MACGLSCIGVIWAFLSFMSMGLSSVGFYMPFWIAGTMPGEIPAHINSFRRCNYPRLEGSGKVRIVYECGHYTTFHDIPSLWWQICTVCVGVGCGILILVGFTAILGCCISDVITRTTSKLAGSFQMLAAVSIGLGCALYPLGWDSREVKQVCGEETGVYQLGYCSLSWAFYTTVAGAGTALFASLLSCHAPKSYRKRTYFDSGSDICST